jgi:tetratricopeptide (TPR) repeat protein
VTALLSCCISQAQTAPATNAPAAQAEPKKPAPTFHAAGIQGNIAPSGYSAGASEEHARQVASLVVDLQAANYASELPEAAKLSCDRQPELLHAALSQPGSLQANLRLGLFYLQHDEPGLSVKYLALARKIAPRDLTVARYLAAADVEAKDYVSAGQLADQLIAANPSDAEAHRIKGAVEAAAGNASAALAEYKLSVTLDPAASSVFSAGLSVMAQGQFPEAEQIFAAGTAAHPKSAKLWLGEGMAEVLQEKGQAADALLRSAALDPAGLLAPTLLANQADSPESNARILPVVQSLAAARPDEAIAHYNYALVLSKSSKANSGPTDASAKSTMESELKAAVKEQPQFAAAHFQLGVFYQDAGDEASAVSELSQAVRLAPDVAEWHYRLARAYRRAGQISSAAAEMESFKQLKAQRDAGGDVSAKLLDGLPPGALGVGAARCTVGTKKAAP